MNPSSCKPTRLGLWADESGVSAIEFALILPIILILLIGLVDTNEALIAHRKMRQVTSTVADLVAQSEELTAAQVDLTLSGAASILSPYPLDPLEIVISVLDITEDGQTVAWSRAYNGTAEASDDPAAFPAPDELVEAGVQIIAVRAEYRLTTIFSTLLAGLTGREGHHMIDRMYERPRLADTVGLL